MEQVQQDSSQIPQAQVTPFQNSSSYGIRFPLSTQRFSLAIIFVIIFAGRLSGPFHAISIDNPSLTPVECAIHSIGVWRSRKGTSTHDSRLLNFLAHFRRLY